jgi:Tfp pilus assembly protein PilF
MADALADPKQNRAGWGMPAAIVAACLIAYANSFEGPFIFDDYNTIISNPYVKRLWPLWHAAWAPANSGVAGRPVVSLSLAVNFAIGAYNTTGYHIVNLIIHVLCALVLFGVIRRTLLLDGWGGRFADPSTTLAGAVALVWAVHPLLTEGVTYIIQRTETLMSLFLLLTLYSMIRALTSTYPRRWYAAAVAASAIGMGCKEVMAVTPLIVIAYDLTFLPGTARALRRARWWMYLALFATWGVLLPLVLSSGLRAKTGFGLDRMTPWHYLLTQADVITHYLRLCFWPHRLLIDYYDWNVATRISDVWWQGLLILALLIATVVSLIKRWWFGFAGAWFFLILAPTSSILPLGTEVAAERRMYLPSAAVVAVVVIAVWMAGCSIIAQPQVAKYMLLALLIATLSAETFGTWRRNAQYHTAIAIMEDAVDQRTQNPRAHHSLASAILVETHPQNTAWAEAELRRTLEIEPGYASAIKMLGEVLEKRDPQEAVRFEEDVVARYPKRADNRVLLGQFYAKVGRTADAEKSYQTALDIDPDDADALYELGYLRLKSNQPAEAERYFRSAIAARRDFADAHNALGVALARQRRFDEAIAEIQTALVQQPDFDDAKRNLEAVREQRGK